MNAAILMRLLFALSLLLAGSAPAAAQVDSTRLLLPKLLGFWQGEGQLMGRSAAFELCWREVLGGRFVRLDFSNFFVAGAERQKVLEAVGYYRPDAAASQGTWVDGRGYVFALDVQQTPTSMIVGWRGDTESGVSTYTLTADSSLTVTDQVRQEGQLRPFATSTLRRVVQRQCG